MRATKSGRGLVARALARAAMAAGLLAAGTAMAGDVPASVTPTLRVDTAVYDVTAGVLQFAYTLANPADSTLYLDCQVPPRAVLEGSTLTLTFSRAATDADGVLAGGPPPGADGTEPAPAVRPEDYPPQRIAGGQSFQGQRRLDRVLGVWEARPKFSSVRLKVDYYPERAEGEGPMFMAERSARVTTPAHGVTRKGKAPAPAKPVRIRRPG